MSLQPELDIEEAEPASTVSLKELVVNGVARSRFLVGGLALAGTVIGLVVAAGLPNEYTSHAALRWAAGRREMLTLAPEQRAGVGDDLTGWPAVSDEILLLGDDRIYESAADKLGPGRLLKPADPMQFDSENTPGPIRLLHGLQAFLFNLAAEDVDCESAQDREECLVLAGQVLKDHTTLWADRGSAVITVTHTSTSPTLAFEATKALLDAFLARHRQEYSASRHVDRNRETTSDAFLELELSQREYGSHVGECGFIDLDTQMSSLIQDVDELTREIALKESRRDEVFQRAELLTGQLESVPEFIDRVVPAETGHNRQLDTYWNQLSDLDLQKLRVQSDSSLTIEQRRVREADIQDLSDAVRAKMEDIPPVVELVPEYVDKVPNPEHGQLVATIGLLKAEDQGLGLGIQRLRGFLQERREQLNLARECERSHGAMEREIGKAQKRFEQHDDRLVELEVLAALDTEGESNLSVFQAPTLPREKDGPERMQTLLIGLFGGLFLGVALAVLRQLLDGRLRYPGTVERALGVRVIAVLPESRGVRKLADRASVLV